MAEKLHIIVIAMVYRDSIRNALNFQRVGNSPAASSRDFSTAVDTKLTLESK